MHTTVPLGFVPRKNDCIAVCAYMFERRLLETAHRRPRQNDDVDDDHDDIDEDDDDDDDGCEEGDAVDDVDDDVDDAVDDKTSEAVSAKSGLLFFMLGQK